MNLQAILESRCFPPYLYGGQDLVFWRTPVYTKLQVLKFYSWTIYYRLSPGVRKIYLADAYGGRLYLDSTMAYKLEMLSGDLLMEQCHHEMSKQLSHFDNCKIVRHISCLWDLQV